MPSPNERARRAQLRKMTGAPTLRQAVDAALEAYVRAPALPGIRTPVTQARGWMARVRALDGWLGEKAAAAAAGVTPRTWRSWKRGGKPSARSLAGLQGGYERQLEARGQTPARKRVQARRWAAEQREAQVIVFAEVQWEGYYNGQGATSPKDVPYAPDPGNAAAYRDGGIDFGRIPLAPVLRAWAAGRDTGMTLEDLLSDQFSTPARGKMIFCNTYRNGAEVRIG